jgi:putative transposase
VATGSVHRLLITPNVLDRRGDGCRVNQASVVPMTDTATGEGWPHLACVMDLASRRIASGSMSDQSRTHSSIGNKTSADVETSLTGA